MSRIEIDPNLVETYVMDLAKIGAYGETGIWRPVYTDAWQQAQDQIAKWAGEAGLEVYRDAVGNVWGRLPGSDDSGKVIASGSHIDSQLPGGRYDGALGVISALIALKTLKERFGTPKRTLEMVSLCEEESSRFPTGSMLGTRAITGDLTPEFTENATSYDGDVLADAMREMGLDPAKIPDARRHDIDTFVELHIEQGPILEEQGLPVAVVTGITGARTYVVTVRGREDHAGGRPMDMRLDPMAGAAEIISGVINTAHRMGRPAVTTCGRIQSIPNLPSVVPQQVTFTINVRHLTVEGCETLYARHEGVIREVCERRGLSYDWEIRGEREVQPMDPEMIQFFLDVAKEQGIGAIPLGSGGGHDARRMAQIAKTVMLFVQSKDGRSHSPDEFTSIEDATAGVKVLAAGLHKLAY